MSISINSPPFPFSKYSTSATVTEEPSPAPSLSSTSARVNRMYPLSLTPQKRASMTHDDLERLTPEQRDWKLRDGVHISSSLQKRLRLAREQQREQEAGWSREFEWPSWGMPVATQIESFSCLFPFPCAVCFSIGRGRKTMEDRHLAASISVNILGNEKTAHVFGKFDGHLSSCASEFVQK